MLIDLGLSLFSVFLAFNLRFNFRVPESETNNTIYIIASVLVVRGASFLILRSYSGFVRYTSSQDVQRLLMTTGVGSAVFLFLNPAWQYASHIGFPLPTSVILIDFLFLSLAMIGYRLLVKVIYFEYRTSSNARENVLIFGAGESGIITKRTFDRDFGRNIEVLAFIDENPKKVRRKIEGIEIIGFDELPHFLGENQVDRLVIAVSGIDHDKKSEIIKVCLPFQVKVQSIPPVSRWINGELSARQLRDVRIEDLLGRAPIKLNERAVVGELKQKCILITGAAGSIGSGLVRQIAPFAKGKLVLLDQAESGLYDLDIELRDQVGNLPHEIVIGSIRNAERMRRVFEAFRPQMVFHAAAYKHVPMMEENPTEAIRTNVMGTKILVDLSIEFGVEKFVLISTDKAVNPTNVMGASKRIAEIYAQSSLGRGPTRFITTRFGNVLGSNGSVIPLFRRQIERGGPVTVTHPEITRYFMTIQEACQLVLEAAAMGEGGEIFMFDMGQPVKIVDLAKQMIRLSGLELGKDMQIVFTGERPGEKLYEELLANEENTLKTNHKRILKATVRNYDWHVVAPKIEELIALYDTQNNQRVVKLMKELVPEYLSMNSQFAQLDAPQPVAE